MSSEVAQALARAAIDAVEPRRCTREALARAGIDEPVTLFAFGKAARGMTAGALDVVQAKRGIVIARDDAPIGSLVVRTGGHPAPSTDAIELGDEVLALAGSLGAGDVALVLVSGGGSAMLERPIDGISIAQITETSRALMHAGADIGELNAVRRCLSRIKGGGLAEALFPARVVVVVISDVPGQPISVVASGPCAPPDTTHDAREVVLRRGLEETLDPVVRAAIAARAERSPPREVFERVETLLAADVETAVRGVRDAARDRGISLGAMAPFSGREARDEGPRFVREAAQQARDEGLDGILAGCETTVTVRGPGHGGRNHEAALAVLIAGIPPRSTYVAVSTDGVDGSSAGAGAWVDDDLVARADALALDGRAHLDASDSDAFFRRAGGQLVTGPTGTNVADVWIWWAARSSGTR